MRHLLRIEGVAAVRRRSRGFGLAALTAVFALTTILFAIPATAATSEVTWDFSTGLDLPFPPSETEIADLTVSDPAGSACTAEVEAVNGQSSHRTLDIEVTLNGGLVMLLEGIEDTPFQVSSDSFAFTSSGSDEFVVTLVSERSRIASSTGSLTVTCEPPAGGEGCTPGYWKQEHHFDSWAATGLLPGDSFDATFGVDGSFATLLDGLKANGGGENALARHAVAALLNATHPDVAYDLTAAEVIGMVQDAYNTGQFETIKNILNDANEAGCSLN